jgi:hypothetical protein
MFRKKVWVIGVLLLLMPVFGFAAEIKNIRFADSVTVDQTVLKVRGVAVLKWAMFFDVYAGAFYMQEGFPSRAWDNDLPKRLELAYLRKIKAADIVASSDQLLRRNLSAAEYQAVEERLKKFLLLFRDVKPGDRYRLTYSPEMGTELSLNGQPLGTIPGADFSVAYFGIWLGQKPISSGFRDGLLGNR